VVKHKHAHLRKPFGWSKEGNHIFGRCECCGGLTIRGVCQPCGRSVVCAWCGVVKQPQGDWRKQRVYENRKTSHGICKSCLEEYQNQRRVA
jgi:hypothetical protein